MAKPRVIVRDRGYASIVKEIAELSDSFITVGVHGDAGEHEGGASIAQVASWNEFGTENGHVPERSFIRSTMDGRMKDLRAVQSKTFAKVVSGEIDAKDGLDIVGQWAAAAIQKKIVDLDSPPNAPSTIARKGSSNPLIDTGQLRQSITYVTHRGSPKGTDS